MSSVKLSVVVITYNEEKNIGRCLDSVQKIADDIVVVDSFSKDKTKEIALSKGARFVEHVFEGHIQQKNWAITQAKYPYILSLDADEALDSTLTDEILKAKENWDADGYRLNRMTNYCGSWIRHGNWYPDIKLRLWDSRKGEWGGMNPHDEFLMETNSTIKRLKGDILHYSFYHFEQHLQQIHKFTDISSKAAFERGKRATLLNLVLNPFAEFVGGYIINGGFLDGKAGFRISRYSAYATFLKYSKILKLQKENKN